MKPVIQGTGALIGAVIGFFLPLATGLFLSFILDKMYPDGPGPGSLAFYLGIMLALVGVIVGAILGTRLANRRSARKSRQKDPKN